jgi:hypothetical protein
MRRSEAGVLVVGLALAVAAVASGCLVDSRCVSKADCTGNEICADGECVLECIDGDLSRCTTAQPFCLIAENRCVECLLPEDCGDAEQCVTGACVPGLAPDFELVDMNENSPTFEQTLALNDYDGGVAMLFFATLG